MRVSASGAERSALAVYGVAIAALVLWAGTPVANKLAVASIDPVTVGLLRSVAAEPDDYIPRPRTLPTSFSAFIS